MAIGGKEARAPCNTMQQPTKQEGRNERRRRDERGREGQEARKCDPMRQPTNEEEGGEVGVPTERLREATGKHDNQLNKWGAIAQQKVKAPVEGFGKAKRTADKRRRHDNNGATTTTTILYASHQQSGPA